ncbi:MAG: tRNA lysidine(34) synthetase TilS [Saprospiraceae bacterium]
MHDRFITFIELKGLLGPGDKVLLATSGGVDSMVMCHLFRRAGLPFAVAHCNFQLRAAASDQDEQFVRQMAVSLGVPFFCQRFDTVAFSNLGKISIQEAARKLRYEWLEKTRQDAGCAYIATAHHLDDSIETVLFNFSKGCGIRGLHGILPKQGNLIRPLLFATKKELLAFAQGEEIGFREDASNLTDKYSRNLIRHHAVPVFEKINPSFQRSAEKTIARLLEVESLYDFVLDKIREDVLEPNGPDWKIHLAKLAHYPALPTVLYELLHPFGFNSDQAVQILQSIDNQPGKMFFSPDWQLLVDRFLLILSKGEKHGGVIRIPSIQAGSIALADGLLQVELVDGPPSGFSKKNNEAWLDYGKITFPLTLRHWQPGDSFCPLGMGGKHQKLQDFFSNNKLDRFEKERIWLLESGGEICWVVGHRLDERFKVAQKTEKCLVARFTRKKG